MALTDFVVLPILTGNKEDNSVKVNIHNIVEARVIQKESADKWYVAVKVLPDRLYYINVAGTPFADKASAIVARDVWLDTF